MKRLYVPESFVYMIAHLRKKYGELKRKNDTELMRYVVPIPVFLNDEKEIYKLFKTLKRIRNAKFKRDIILEMLEGVELK